MRKRISLIMMALVFIVPLFAGCGSGMSQADYDALIAERDSLQASLDELTLQDSEAPPISLDENGDNEESIPVTTPDGQGVITRENPAGAFNAEEIANNLIVHQYSYQSSTGRVWVYHVIENTSEHVLEISGSLRTYDSAGNIVGAKTASERAVGPGQMTILDYMLDTAFDTSEYEMTVSEDTRFVPVTQDLSFEASQGNNMEIITVTNNGEIPARFVQVHVLFFNDGILVNHGSRYFTDSDNEIKPDRSITEEIRCRDSYNSIVVVLTGRGG